LEIRLTGLPVKKPVEIAAAAFAIQQQGQKILLFFSGKDDTLLAEGKMIWLGARVLNRILNIYLLEKELA
jgi:hypothetical protein